MPSPLRGPPCPAPPNPPNPTTAPRVVLDPDHSPMTAGRPPHPRPTTESATLAICGAALSLGVLVAVFAARPLSAQEDTATHVLTLGDAARLAAHQSAAARAAHAQAQESTAERHLKRGSFLPTLYGYGQESELVENSAALLRFPPLPTGSPFNLNALLPPAGIDFPPIKSVDLRGYAYDTLFNFSAIQRYRQAQTAERASYTVASSTAESAANTAATSYLSAQQANAVLAARLADSSLAADLLNIARQQLQAGVGIALDVTRAQAQLASTRAQLIAARADRDRTQLDLLRALGLSLDAHIVLSDSLNHMPVSDTLPGETAEIDLALRHRPDLRALDEQLSAAEQQVSAIRAERLPSLEAFGNKGVQGGNYIRLLDVYTWGVGVSVPVFDGFRRESRIEEQEAVSRQLEIQRRDLQQQAAIDVRRAFLDLGAARQQLDAANEQLTLTQQELSESRERFRAGVAGNADVITASLDLNSARTQEVNALASYQAARVSLARATGAVTELP
jgi:outer membrane protein